METFHILLIEDDPAVAASVQAGLRRENFAVTWKPSGGEGLAFAQKEFPHLVLLDVRLPDGSGFDFCRQFRMKELRMPVILLTVQRDEIDKVLGLEMGADDYVTKPFSLRELTARIRAHLRRAYGELSPAGSNVLYAGDVVIDLSLGRATRAGADLDLTPTELRLLAYLARNRGQALTRAQIVDAVWGHTPDADSERTVNVHIRRLREKVELDPARPTLIRTVPGLGYRLVK
jgi:DNA-binding response OmpR family regulator